MMMNTQEIAAHHTSQRSRLSHSHGGHAAHAREPFSPIEPLRPLGKESSHGVGHGAFRAGIAHTAWQREQAQELVRRRYRYAGYRIPLALHAVDAEHRTLTALAVRGLTPIGTLSLWRDGVGGLQADKLFANELANLRASGAQLAQFGRLAFDAPTTFTRLLSPLVHTAAQLALAEWGMTDIIVECNPRHVDFYCRALGFDTLSGPVDCPRIGAPAVLLHLTAAHALETFTLPAGHQRVNALRSSIVPQKLPF